MRIVVVSNLYPPHGVGGYELRCRAYVDGLRRRGHDVHVVTSRLDDDDQTDPDPPGIDRALHLSWSPPYPPEDVAGLLRCEWEDRQAIAAVVDRVRPDVIDIWGMEACSQSTVAALLAGPVPVHLTVDDIWLLDGCARDTLCGLTAVASAAGVAFTPAIGRVCRLGLTRPSLGTAPVCFVSSALADRYRAGGFSHPHQCVRMAGIDVSPFRALAPPSSPPPFVVVNVGQLTRRRGQADLIEAAARVAVDARCPWPLELRIVGPGTAAYRAELDAVGARCACDRLTVHFAGAVPPDEVARAYAGAHLFVHPSRLPEGLPRVLMEAMSAGVPVVATDTGGQRDVLADGRWGRLVPPGRPDVLADAIRGVIGEWPRWRVRADQARAYALERFDQQACIDRHEQDLKELEAAGRRAPAESLPGSRPSDAELNDFAARLGAAAEGRADACDVAGEPDGVWRWAVVLKRTGRLAAADDWLARLLAAHESDPTQTRRVAFHRGELAMVQGEWERAADLLRACLAVAPDHAKAAYDLRHAEAGRLPAHLAGLCRAMAVHG